MDGKVKQEFLDEMEKWVKKQSARLKEIKGLGTGGNISKLYRMSGAQQKGEFMPIAQLEEMYRKICTMSVKVFYELRLNPDRADVIEYAARIYLQTMKWRKVDEILAPRAGLKEGFIPEVFSKVDSNKK